jgi:hypothetical protein
MTWQRNRDERKSQGKSGGRHPEERGTATVDVGQTGEAENKRTMTQMNGGDDRKRRREASSSAEQATRKRRVENRDRREEGRDRGDAWKREERHCMGRYRRHW